MVAGADGDGVVIARAVVAFAVEQVAHGFHAIGRLALVEAAGEHVERFLRVAAVEDFGEGEGILPERVHHVLEHVDALLEPQLVGGEILLLSGPLGAGKSVFVKGLASALDIDPEEVTSPSFTLVNPYKGKLSLYHIDLYRLDEGVAAAHAVDLDELLMDEQAVIVIEWAERLGGYRLPSNTWRISISGDGDEPRTVIVRTGSGSDRVE